MSVALPTSSSPEALLVLSGGTPMGSWALYDVPSSNPLLVTDELIHKKAGGGGSKTGSTGERDFAGHLSAGFTMSRTHGLDYGFAWFRCKALVHTVVLSFGDGSVLRAPTAPSHVSGHRFFVACLYEPSRLVTNAVALDKDGRELSSVGLEDPRPLIQELVPRVSHDSRRPPLP